MAFENCAYIITASHIHRIIPVPSNPTPSSNTINGLMASRVLTIISFSSSTPGHLPWIPLSLPLPPLRKLISDQQSKAHIFSPQIRQERPFFCYTKEKWGTSRTMKMNICWSVGWYNIHVSVDGAGDNIIHIQMLSSLCAIWFWNQWVHRAFRCTPNSRKRGKRITFLWSSDSSLERLGEITLPIWEL